MDTNRPMCCDAGRAIRGVFMLAALAGIAAGCAHSNDRNDLGGGYAGLEPGVVLRGVSGAEDSWASETGAGTPNPDAIAADPDRPTLDLARSGWPQRTFLVPVTATASGQTYAETHRTIDAAARDRGAFPTPTSALELSPNDYWDVAADAWAAGPFAVYELILMPYRAIRAAGPDWRQPEQRGTTQAYSRAPAWTARGVPSGTTRGDELPPATPGRNAEGDAKAMSNERLPNPLD